MACLTSRSNLGHRISLIGGQGRGLDLRLASMEVRRGQSGEMAILGPEATNRIPVSVLT